jgi:hypothetical protein
MDQYTNSPIVHHTQELCQQILALIAGKSRLLSLSPTSLLRISETYCIYYSTNARITPDYYLSPSMIICSINARMFVYYSKMIGIQYLRHYNVREYVLLYHS